MSSPDCESNVCVTFSQGQFKLSQYVNIQKSLPRADTRKNKISVSSVLLEESSTLNTGYLEMNVQLCTVT